jgi:hypothetical protein
MPPKNILYRHVKALGVTSISMALLVSILHMSTMFTPVPTTTVTTVGVEYLQRKQLTNIYRQMQQNTAVPVHAGAPEEQDSKSVIRWFLITQ